MNLKFKKPGMRNIKTAIAVVISILISKLFKMEYPFYAAIASVICMQSSIENSIETGKNRMLGTVVGALFGFICAVIAPGNVFLLGLGIVGVIYVCNIFKWNNSASIGCVVLCAIMLNLKEGSALLYSVNRIFDTFVGITVAVAVNNFISPPNEKDKEIQD